MFLVRLDLEIYFEEDGTIDVLHKFFVRNIITLRLNEVFDHTIHGMSNMDIYRPSCASTAAVMNTDYVANAGEAT